MQALVNVPALSERTLRRDISRSGVSTGSQIQVHVYSVVLFHAVSTYIIITQTEVIERFCQSNPCASVWIKGDGVDIQKGLCESVRGEWSGDVDLNDGKLQEMFTKYRKHVEWIAGVRVYSVPPQNVPPDIIH